MNIVWDWLTYSRFRSDFRFLRSFLYENLLGEIL